MVESYTSPGEYTYTVPTGVEEVTVRCWGAGGATAPQGNSTSAGANGGYAEATIPVNGGDTIYVRVGGGASGQTGGYNGGASGRSATYSDANADSPDDFTVVSGGAGGASDIRLNGNAAGDRVVVAGGGGGGGAASGTSTIGSVDAIVSGGGGAGGGTAADGGDAVAPNNTASGGVGGGASDATGDQGSAQVSGRDTNGDGADEYAYVACGGGGAGGQAGGTGGNTFIDEVSPGDNEVGGAGGGGGDGAFDSIAFGASSSQGGGNSGDGQVELVPRSVLSTPATNVRFASPQPALNTPGVAGISADNPETIQIASLTPTLNQIYRLQTPTTSVEFASPTSSVTGTGAAPIQQPTAKIELQSFGGVVAFNVWVIDGQPIGTVTDETTTDKLLSVTARATTTELLNQLRTLKSDEGKLSVLPNDDGGFVAVDRADGNNTFRVLPPASRFPLRQESEYLVQKYEESLVSSDVGEWDVELELVRDADRADTPSLSESPDRGASFPAAFPMVFADNSEWAFETRYGTIVTSRVDADLVGTGESGVQRFEVTARLRFGQAHVFEAALSQLGGARVREIPDGDNVAVDDSAGDAATLVVDAPDSQSVVGDGDYVVLEWQSTRLNGEFQSVEFVIAST